MGNCMQCIKFVGHSNPIMVTIMTNKATYEAPVVTTIGSFEDVTLSTGSGNNLDARWEQIHIPTDLSGNNELS